MRNVTVEDSGTVNDAYHERVPLTSEDLDRVNNMRLTAHAIHFNNSHVMIVDGEHVVWIAGDIHQTNTVPGEVTTSGVAGKRNPQD